MNVFRDVRDNFYIYDGFVFSIRSKLTVTKMACLMTMFK